MLAIPVTQSIYTPNARCDMKRRSILCLLAFLCGYGGQFRQLFLAVDAVFHSPMLGATEGFASCIAVSVSGMPMLLSSDPGLPGSTDQGSIVMYP